MILKPIWASNMTQIWHTMQTMRYVTTLMMQELTDPIAVLLYCRELNRLYILAKYYFLRRWVLPLSTQCLQNSAETGERSILTLGSLCLPCYVWDTAWSWLFFLALHCINMWLYVIGGGKLVLELSVLRFSPELETLSVNVIGVEKFK